MSISMSISISISISMVALSVRHSLPAVAVLLFVSVCHTLTHRPSTIFICIADPIHVCRSLTSTPLRKWRLPHQDLTQTQSCVRLMDRFYLVHSGRSEVRALGELQARQVHPKRLRIDVQTTTPRIVAATATATATTTATATAT